MRKRVNISPSLPKEGSGMLLVLLPRFEILHEPSESFLRALASR